MSETKQKRILKILLIFILLQPILDVLSRMAILEYIPRISTFIKPLFVFGVTGYLLLFYSPKKKRWLVYIISFLILAIGHTYLLCELLTDKSIILHEFRFLINIAYMVSLYISFDTIYYYSTNKAEMYRQIKKTILNTFIIYFGLYLIAIITNTSGMTYEIADKSKLGYKGWYDSGQILGHTYAIMLPLLMYVTLDPQRKWYKRALIIILFLISVSLLGTKTPYYITIAVLILYLIITITIKLFNKDHKPNLFNIIFISLMVCGMLFTYKYTPVRYNTLINKEAAGTSITAYQLAKESGYDTTYDETELRQMYPNNDITELIKYNNWSRETSKYLISLFETNKLHPADTRNKQIKYATYKYSLASFKYKLFGIGFLNQSGTLSLESDFMMAIFSFGILGFILFLGILIKEFIITTIYILKNIKFVDLQTYMLYMGLGIFFAISIFAGYTYIYTNFSVFLMLLIMMLKIKKDILKKVKIKDNKISFLLLHLGYGGIETAVINTANALSKEYDVELISLYKVKNNQTSRINQSISIKYLYDGEPNKEAFLNSLKRHKYFKVLFEGIKAIYILILKRILITIEILNSDAKYLISTRYEFSILLSKYGSSSNIKIAEEHCYHNNNHKYIKILSNKYYNIDYLFALTKTLEEDYHKFLHNNHHTKIVLIPNMLSNLPTKKSDLTSKKIITMSRLDQGKKNDDIIRAFSNISDDTWQLYILGDGEELSKLKSLVKELKLEKRVFLPGYIKKEDLEKYLLDASIFVMASLTEGLPMVLLEAMSYGIPCVAYETASGTGDIITNGYNGYLIKNRDQSQYVDALNRIIKDTKLRQTLGNNAIITSKKFSEENIIQKWNKVLRSDQVAKDEKKEK